MRHRKIPGKKHKGYKDPESQQAARNEKLSVKVSKNTSFVFSFLCLDVKWLATITMMYFVINH